MKPLRLLETSNGKFSLCLDAGSTAVDELVLSLGHEPNGYFWEGVATWLLATEANELRGRFDFDPEAGMFVAYGADEEALRELGALLAKLANDGDAMTALIGAAEAAGHDFDD
jgi:hypothetical protein